MDYLLRRRWYNHNSKMRREGLRAISFTKYLAYVAERDRLKQERGLLRQPKGGQVSHSQIKPFGTREHGVLSAKVAMLDHTNFDTHALDKMVRLEGACTYRPYWRSVGEGCWRKRGRFSG